MKLAFIFPGQGAQYVGMGKDLYDNALPAKKIFDEVDQALGFSLSQLCFKGPFEELTKTENCQPAVMTASIAALVALKAIRPDLTPEYVAGLSLGEYAALVAADILKFGDAVHLVRKRGEFMEAAAKKNPGKMACILGLETNAVEAILKETGGQIANLNCPGQVVVSATNAQFEVISLKATEHGAKRVISLDVSGAFHCSLMDEASQRLKSEIEKVKFHTPRCPLISNVDATPQTDPAVIKANLIKQVNNATYWEKSMRNLLQKGINDFLEIGPGNVLRGLFKKIDANARVINVGRWDDVQEAKKIAL